MHSLTLLSYMLSKFCVYMNILEVNVKMAEFVWILKNLELEALNCYLVASKQLALLSAFQLQKVDIYLLKPPFWMIEW